MRLHPTILSVLLLVSCGQASKGSDSSGGPGPGPTPDPTQGTGSNIEPGQLTAGDWDDNLNFDLFLEYIDEARSRVPGGAGVDVRDRIVISVRGEAGMPVPNALVSVSQGGRQLVSAPTATDGRVLFFPSGEGVEGDEALSVTIEKPGSPAAVFAPPEGSAQWTFELPEASAALPDGLDLAFVIDCTGSMSDELSYIQGELQSIVDAIEDEYAVIDARYALVVYRDHGDEYVARAFDFTPDVSDFRHVLDSQRASGGGDYPEAMELALGEMNGLSWREGNVARVAFLIADAPPHDGNAQAVIDEAQIARSGGIKIYPVASSGVADTAEYVMRVSAQLTMARYLFLTDDSGLGNSHAEPHLPCYQVQYLNDLMVRMIMSNLMGAHVPPAADAVIRTVGEPEDGVCALQDGSLAYL